MVFRPKVVVFCIIFSICLSTVGSVMRNCYRNLPIQFKIDLPEKIEQSVNQPLNFEINAVFKYDKILKGPFIFVVDVRKEWFEGFDSAVPCTTFGYEHCRILVTPKMMRKAGYHYPFTRKHFHKKLSISLQSIPDYLLEGKYKIELVLWTFTPHKKLLACIKGPLNLHVKH